MISGTVRFVAALLVTLSVIVAEAAGARTMEFNGRSWGTVVQDVDTEFPQTNIFAAYSGACAPIVGLSLNAVGPKQSMGELQERLDKVIAEAASVVSSLCPVMRTLQVGLSFDHTQVKSAGETDASKGWRLTVREHQQPEPGYTAFRRIGGRPGGVRVSPDGTADGYVQVRDTVHGRFNGQVTPQQRMGETSYIFEGMLYEPGDVEHQCPNSLEGYAYWGSFELRVESNNRIRGSGTFRACSEGKEGGEGELMTMVSDAGHTANPFNVVKNENVNTNQPDDPTGNTSQNRIELASGDGWRVTTSDRYWCVNQSPLRMDYDVDHRERNKLFGGEYGPFFRRSVEPTLRAKCPSLAYASIANFRTGEDTAWDTMVLSNFKNPGAGLRLGTVTQGQAQMHEVYTRACAACHATGAGGAPRTGIREEWPKFAGSLERASWDEIYHFNRLHCPDCTKDALEALNRVIRNENSLPELTTFTLRQKRMMAYANSPTVENLMKSDLLIEAKVIAALYLGREEFYPRKEKLRQLFRQFIIAYDHKCSNFLPANAATYNYYYEDLDVQHTATGRIDTRTTEAGRSIRMLPGYYDVFAEQPGANGGLALNFDDPLEATRVKIDGLGEVGEALRKLVASGGGNRLLHAADTRALLANDSRCSDPAIRRYIDNLHAALN